MLWCDFCQAPAERIVQRRHPPHVQVATCRGECLATLRRACAEAGVQITIHDVVDVEVGRPWKNTDLNVAP